MSAKRDRVRRTSTKPATVKQAISAANQQIWQREFNPDYDQVVLRISTAPLNSLRFGHPPPVVGHGG